MPRFSRTVSYAKVCLRGYDGAVLREGFAPSLHTTPFALSLSKGRAIAFRVDSNTITRHSGEGRSPEKLVRDFGKAGTE